MLHLIYILAFTIVAFLAISNLIRSLITISYDAGRNYPSGKTQSMQKRSVNSTAIPHPELLDDDGRLINEPLLIMRSVSVEDARQQLDAIYNSSPSPNTDPEE